MKAVTYTAYHYLSDHPDVADSTYDETILTRFKTQTDIAAFLYSRAFKIFNTNSHPPCLGPAFSRIGILISKIETAPTQL